MVCACALLPNNLRSGLILSRNQSEYLSNLIGDIVNEKLFVFNTNSGVYFFSTKENLNSMIVKLVMEYLSEHLLKESHFTLSRNTKIFDDSLVKILTDKEISSLGWKNFISSFLNQLDPFYGDPMIINGLFKRFVYLIKEYGNNQQLEYMKKRMNILRSRVDLDLAKDII